MDEAADSSEDLRSGGTGAPTAALDRHREDAAEPAGFEDLSSVSLRAVRQQLTYSDVLADGVARAMADLEDIHPPAASFNAAL